MDNSEETKTEEIKDKISLEGADSQLSKAGLTANCFRVALGVYTYLCVTDASRAPSLSWLEVLKTYIRLFWVTEKGSLGSLVENIRAGRMRQ